MTDFIWGEPIFMGGKRPKWLRDDERVQYMGTVGQALGWAFTCDKHGYRLPANHAYYAVQRHNAQHGTNFTYWPGGENAPDDWDKGDVLLRDGETINAPPVSSWHRGFKGDPLSYAYLDIVGYTRRVEQPAHWALVKANQLTGVVPPPYYIPTPHEVAFARYIEQHEKPPVDPDVLAVREILAARWDGLKSTSNAAAMRAGTRDQDPGFAEALAAYRASRP